MGSLEVPLDVVRERLERRDVDDVGVARRASPVAAPRATRRSRHERNAASVLPEPVGAVMSASPPAAMAGQARACTGVGAPKRSENQAWTTG